jgi:hypothetical protein
VGAIALPERLKKLNLRLSWTLIPAHKYYAYFESSADYELYTAAELCAILEKCIADGGSMQYGYLARLNGYYTLSEAKNYLIGHFNGELADARRHLAEVRAYRGTK